VINQKVLEEMVTVRLIDGWNGSADAAQYRNELRRRLGWDGSVPFSELLLVLLEENSHAVCDLGPHAIERIKSRDRGQPGPEKRIRDISHILEKFEKADTLKAACEALLNSGWDFTDPAGLCSKPADEMRDFIKSRSVQNSSYERLGRSPSRRNLFDMIVDTYGRALDHQDKLGAGR
jgi:hypothetical protein